MAACPPLAPEVLRLGPALGCVLAEDVTAREMVPPFDNTAVDGYAVQAADTEGAPVELEVLGVLAAGAAPAVSIGPRPGAADHDRRAAPGRRRRRRDGGGQRDARRGSCAPHPHRHRRASRYAGSATTCVEGEVVLDGGHHRAPGPPRRPGQHRRARSCRCTVRPVSACSRPATSSSRRGAPLRPGQIRESNRPMLLGLVEQAGAEPVDLGLVRDDEAALDRSHRAGGRDVRCHRDQRRREHG